MKRDFYYKFCFWISLLILQLTACNSLDKDRASTLIHKSIEAHGGMSPWQSMDTMVYKKEITLYDELGSVRKYIEQQHNYSLSAGLKGRYAYADSVIHEVVFDGESAHKILDGKSMAPDDSALRNFYSAYYVLNMP